MAEQIKLLKTNTTTNIVLTTCTTTILQKIIIK